MPPLEPSSTSWPRARPSPTAGWRRSPPPSCDATPEEQVAALLAVAPQLPAELSDLATVIAGFRSVGTPKEGEVAAKLEPLAQPERPFHASALELEALAAARKGDLAAARKMWNEIIKDPATPQGAQQRAQALLTLYGPAEGK